MTLHHAPSRPSFVPWPSARRSVDPSQLRLAVSNLAVALLLFAAMIVLIVRYL